MSKFKIGDKVRCINQKNYGAISVGEITEVTGISNNGNLRLQCYDTDSFYYDSVDFELVENPKLFFYELEPGFLYEMIEKNQKVYIKDGKLVDLIDNKSLGKTYHFKCLGKYEPNKLKLESLNYDVEFKENEIKVGCQTISKEDILKLKDELNKRYK